MDYNYLQHHGTKGQRWGHRRYQNKDGSLTEAGKKRYARDAREKGYNKQDDSGTYYKTNNEGKNREDLEIDADRYVREDMSRTKRVADESSRAANKLGQMADKSLRNQPKPKMDLSNMSDQQMRNEINRALLERQYNDMFAPQKQAKGREFAKKALEVGGDILAVGSSALAIALAIKELKGPKGGSS